MAFELADVESLSLHDALPILWRWQVVRYGTPDQVVQWQDGDQRVMVVPPGEYQVTMQPVYGASERVVWPRSEGHTSGLQLPYELVCRLRLEMQQGMGPLWRWP